MVPRRCLALASSTLSQLTKHVFRIFDRFYLSRFWIKRSRQEHRQSRPRTDHSHLSVAILPFFFRAATVVLAANHGPLGSLQPKRRYELGGHWSALPIRTQVTQCLAIRSKESISPSCHSCLFLVLLIPYCHPARLRANVAAGHFFCVANISVLVYRCWSTVRHGYICSLDANILGFTSILGHTGLGNTNIQFRQFRN
jgi:hypothetical protein